MRGWQEMSGDVRGCQGMPGDVRECQGKSGDVRGCQEKLIQQSQKSSIQTNFLIRVSKSSKSSWHLFTIIA